MRRLHIRVITYLSRIYHIYLSTSRRKTHLGDCWLRTDTNVAHRRSPYHDRIDYNYFVLVRCHCRIRSSTTAGQYDCFEMFKIIVLVLRIEVYSYCIAEHRVNSCQFLLVCVSSCEHSYQFVADSYRFVLLAWCESIRCNKMSNDDIHVQTNNNWHGVDTTNDDAVDITHRDTQWYTVITLHTVIHSEHITHRDTPWYTVNTLHTVIHSEHIAHRDTHYTQWYTANTLHTVIHNEHIIHRDRVILLQGLT